MMRIVVAALVLAVASASSFRRQLAPPPNPASNAQDCETHPGPWGPCSASCGGGYRSRLPVIVKEASGYGKKCPELHEERENCNPQPCPVDCVVEEGEFSACSASCGPGFQTKVGYIVLEARYGGKECPPESSLSTTIPCQGPPCPEPVNCQLGYQNFGQCSKPCGGGISTREAYIIREAQHGGAPCPKDLSLLTDTKPCNEHPCVEPKDCEFIEGNFGECSASCGEGIQRATLYIVSQAENGGKKCPTELYRTKPCNAGPCPQPKDCEVHWEQFSRCSASCNGGTQSARGRIVREAIDGGARCPTYDKLVITRTCNNFRCFEEGPKECEIVYGEYSKCSKDCGGGYRYQKGFIKREGDFGGRRCPSPGELIKREPCNPQPCPVPKDCRVQRGYWTTCSASCGGGSQTRKVTILEEAAHGGHPCPSRLTETRSCNLEPCSSGLNQQQSGHQQSHQQLSSSSSSSFGRIRQSLRAFHQHTPSHHSSSSGFHSSSRLRAPVSFRGYN